jgi:hypothetical protein
MLTGLAILVFGGALSVAGYAIVATVAPDMAKIASALRGESQQRFEPLAALVQAERRIEVRRWAAAPAPRAAFRLREAA